MLNKCHFIGIGGIGMSGLARLLLKQKVIVSGSDMAGGPVLDALSQQGAEIFIGHSAKYITPDTTVIYTTDIKKDNPEYLAAKELKCPLLHRSELLQALMSRYQSLAVAGTHGKTTTSALLAWVLESSGRSPSYAIGGIVPQFASNSGTGEGKYFVAEACESDGSFLNYHPYGAIITNIDLDHMDFYRTEKALLEAFDGFAKHVLSPEHFFWCGDDSRLSEMHLKGINYGFGEHCQLKGSKFSQADWLLSLDIEFQGKLYPKVEVALTGRHNALNALAVFGLTLSLGVEETAIREALRSFGGVLRRCEKKGESHGILFLDDYAHHPTEIKATLAAIREVVGERRIVAVYQSHRYSRTKECIGLYRSVFQQADILFIPEIYAARETPIPGISHEVVVDEIKTELKERCQHVPRNELVNVLVDFLRPHDVVVTLGAGDVTALSGQILQQLALKSPPKLKLGLVFGGMSVEHDISLISSSNILSAINKDYYEIEEFAVARDGHWHSGSHSRQSLLTEEGHKNASKMSLETLYRLSACDVVFPVLHGTNGEDGTIQGFFDMLSKAYVGCDHRSAAICMDKVLSKRLVSDAGIAILPYVTFSQSEWLRNKEELLQKINAELVYPLFVKPIHLGSSIGVHKATDLSLLSKYIEVAFRFDTHIIVENGIEQVREIEFALLGNNQITVFPPGEVYAAGNLHDFDSKYGLNPQKAAAPFEARAFLSGAQIEEGMELAKKVYQTLGCSGMARVDTFLDPDGKFWFNEINPIPGFTKYSLYPLICQANGLSLQQLIDRLIILGLERRRHLDRLDIKS